jgi:hypothetical protein
MELLHEDRKMPARRSPIASAKLSDLADSIFLGVNLSRLTDETSPVGSVKVIHVKDVIEDQLSPLEMLDEVSTGISSLPERQPLRTLDILISARGTLMKCALVPPSHVGAIASANFIIVRVRENSGLSQELLWSYLRLPKIQRRILNGVTGTVQPALNVRDIANLSVPIPSFQLQSDLVRLIALANEQYRIASTVAQLRRDEAMDILGQYMDIGNAE